MWCLEIGCMWCLDDLTSIEAISQFLGWGCPKQANQYVCHGWLQQNGQKNKKHKINVGWYGREHIYSFHIIVRLK